MSLAPMDSWPDLRVIIRLLPWTWRLLPRVYADDLRGPLGFSTFEWLFLTLEWWADDPLFTEKPTAKRLAERRLLG